MALANDWPWIVWGASMLGSFAVLEGYAFKHPLRENTLSRFMWSMGQKWPLSLVLFGEVTGGLAVHFYWNWCPALMPLGTGG
jgi:hypothetical protein